MAAPPISCVDLLASIDRTNVPFAAFQMNHDVGDTITGAAIPMRYTITSMTVH
jgi:hypothetical protein